MLLWPGSEVGLTIGRGCEFSGRSGVLRLAGDANKPLFLILDARDPFFVFLRLPIPTGWCGYPQVNFRFSRSLAPRGRGLIRHSSTAWSCRADREIVVSTDRPLSKVAHLATVL